MAQSKLNIENFENELDKTINKLFDCQTIISDISAGIKDSVSRDALIGICEDFTEAMNSIATKFEANLNQLKIEKSLSLHGQRKDPICNRFAEFTFREANLQKFQSMKQVVGVISYFDEYEATVFIFDSINLFLKNLKSEFVKPLAGIPEPGVVFAVDFGINGIFRATSKNDGTKTTLFIDFGWIFEPDEIRGFKMFTLTNVAQNFPSQAISCKLIKSQKKKICVSLLETVLFTILRVDIDKLFIEINHVVDESKRTKSVSKPQICELYADLYEEPMNTSNALKAVLGYVPRDEKRICHFFDPKTGSCFKGNSCRFEHVQKLKDGWTRDQQAVKFQPFSLQAMPNINDTYEIIPTNFIDFCQFYALIPSLSDHSTSILTKILNEPTICGHFKKVKHVLDNFELVLVRLSSEQFRRGRVIEIGENQVKVILVDYGIDVNASYDEIYEWSDQFDHIPFLAHHFYLHDVQMKQSTVNPQVIDEMMSSYVGKKLTAKIKGVLHALFVDLLDEDGFDIGQQLCASGYAEIVPSILPAAKHAKNACILPG